MRYSAATSPAPATLTTRRARYRASTPTPAVSRCAGNSGRPSGPSSVVHRVHGAAPAQAASSQWRCRSSTEIFVSLRWCDSNISAPRMCGVLLLEAAAELRPPGGHSSQSAVGFNSLSAQPRERPARIGELARWRSSSPACSRGFRHSTRLFAAPTHGRRPVTRSVPQSRDRNQATVRRSRSGGGADGERDTSPRTARGGRGSWAVDPIRDCGRRTVTARTMPWSTGGSRDGRTCRLARRAPTQRSPAIREPEGQQTVITRISSTMSRCRVRFDRISGGALVSANAPSDAVDGARRNS